MLCILLALWFEVARAQVARNVPAYGGKQGRKSAIPYNIRIGSPYMRPKCWAMLVWPEYFIDLQALANDGIIVPQYT
jgi:hypothetical protein